MHDPHGEEKHKLNQSIMNVREAEDYRYNHQHIGVVSGNEVSIKKESNCGGWIDLNTDEWYSNDSVKIARVNVTPMSSSNYRALKLNN